MRSLSERLKKRRRSQAGFTLVELLVVLVILGLLLGIVGPRAIDFLSRAKGDVAKIQIQNFGAALDLYRLDVGTYPTTEQGLTALMKAPGGAARWNGPWRDSRRMDPHATGDRRRRRWDASANTTCWVRWPRAAWAWSIGRARGAWAGSWR